MDSAKQQLADRLKSASNILVTVSRDPSVDQLAALLGLTLLLNKQGKHSVAVFSGQVPSTIEFLKPAETIEKNTDSLRDFIIALDKNKADKLRYKVEDNVVRIFITPYKTSISQEDLEFSQGDFNVDVVVALGVNQQQDLDDAITAHGRILHDATVASITLNQDSGLGTIIWKEPQASSLSELVTELASMLDENLLDNQIATALLTGIVAETKRFSNDKTSSQTMSASSALLAAGANQQLVASKLEESPKPPKADAKPQTEKPAANGQAAENNDGTLSIEHDKNDQPADEKSADKASPAPKEATKPPAELPAPQLSTLENASSEPTPPATPPTDHVSTGPPLVTEPPRLGGTLSANTQPEGLDPVTDPLSLPSAEPPQLLNRASPPPATPSREPAPAVTPTVVPTPPVNPMPPPPAVSSSFTPPSSTPAPPPPAPAPAAGQSQTLSQIEQSVSSPHVSPLALDSARDEVSQALRDSPTPPGPIQALNAQPLGEDLHPPAQPPLPTVTPANKPVMPLGPPPAESSDTSPQPAPSNDSLSPSPQVNNPTAPPPVPPPIPLPYTSSNAPKTPPGQANPPL